MTDDISLSTLSTIEYPATVRIQSEPLGENRIVLRIGGMNGRSEHAGRREVRLGHGPPLALGRMEVRIHALL